MWELRASPFCSLFGSAGKMASFHRGRLGSRVNVNGVEAFELLNPCCRAWKGFDVRGRMRLGPVPQ